MKLGILTFFNAHNYGAVWQTFALKKYLSGLGHEVEIINYRNQCIEKNYPKQLRPRLGKRDMLFPTRWGASLKELERCYYSRHDWEEQYKKFEYFIQKFLNVQNETQWKIQVQNCDLIFFGSDQIWEKNIVGSGETIYFGDFLTPAKKVSYAASCYSESSSIDGRLIDGLKDFALISVREKHLADLLQSKLGDGIKIYDVVDPVFLLKGQCYREIVEENLERKTDSDYILFYFVSESEELSKISRYLKQKEHKHIIEIHYYKTSSKFCDWQLADVGPIEFLSLLLYAETIYTNSFHGTAFSLILEKKFWVMNSNMRIANLLNNNGMQDRNVRDFEDWLRKKEDTEYDFSYKETFKHMISMSKGFIDMALNGSLS